MYYLWLQNKNAVNTIFENFDYFIFLLNGNYVGFFMKVKVVKTIINTLKSDNQHILIHCLSSNV